MAKAAEVPVSRYWSIFLTDSCKQHPKFSANNEKPMHLSDTRQAGNGLPRCHLGLSAGKLCKQGTFNLHQAPSPPSLAKLRPPDRHIMSCFRLLAAVRENSRGAHLVEGHACKLARAPLPCTAPKQSTSR